MTNINTPLTDMNITKLSVGDRISLSGNIYTGRDAVLPKIVGLIQLGELTKYDIDLQGAVIFTLP